MREEEAGEHDAAIDRIYEAALGDEAWLVCLSVLAEATGAFGLVFCDLSDSFNAVVSESLREINRLYRERWWREDVFLSAALAPPPKPGVLHDDAFDGRIDRENHPFFRDFLRANGFGRFAAYFSPPLYGTRFILMAQRTLDAGPFTTEQSRALERLAPHVTRALAITGRLRIARSRDDALLAILDKMGYGALIVGPNSRVHASNQMAQLMLGDGLALQDGRLVEGASVPRGLVDGLIKSAIAEAGKSRSALLHRPSGRRPMVLQAMTFSGDLPWTAVQRTETTLIMLIDTDTPAVASQMSIVQSFGLTSAEARVASIVGAGFSPVEAAEQLGSAAGTVRTQLKNVFNKLDLKRQSELVRLMTKLEILGG